LKSKACLVGAVDGGNVNDNFLGDGIEDNITGGIHLHLGSGNRSTNNHAEHGFGSPYLLISC